MAMELKENQDPNRGGALSYNTNSSFLLDASPKGDSLRKTRHAKTVSNDINFSRKREPTSPLKHLRASSVNVDDSKRHKRHVSIQVSNTIPEKNLLQSIESRTNHESPKRHSRKQSVPPRMSKFREATMHDRPSNKPPSLFLRTMQEEQPPGQSRDYSVDQLMEEYHSSISRRDVPTDFRSSSRATQMSGLTFHQNSSIASNATGMTDSTLVGSTMSKESGLSRLGKSISGINPVNLWNKYRSRENLRGGPSPEILDVENQEMVDRQLRAEQAYASYKRSGMLGSLGTRAASSNRVYAPGYTTPVDVSSSNLLLALNMDKPLPDPETLAEPVFQPSQRVSAVPGPRSSRSKFHIRTPSMQDLKRVVSSGNIHKRSASSMSPEKTQIIATDVNVAAATIGLMGPPPRDARSASALKSSRSKKDLVKQARLNRRISDLEAKLEQARSQLENSRGVPPVPAVPSRLGRLQRRGKSQHFDPLPTLFSESLLPTASEVFASMPLSPDHGPPVPPKSPEVFAGVASMPLEPNLRSEPISIETTESEVVASDKFENTAERALRNVLDKVALPASQKNQPTEVTKTLKRAKSSIPVKTLAADPIPGVDAVPSSPATLTSTTGSPKKLRPRANIGTKAVIDKTQDSAVTYLTLSSNPRSSLETLAEERFSLSNNSLRPGSRGSISSRLSSTGSIAGDPSKKLAHAGKRSLAPVTEGRSSFITAPQPAKCAGNAENEEFVTARLDGIHVPPVPTTPLSSAKRSLWKAKPQQQNVETVADESFEWPDDCF